MNSFGIGNYPGGVSDRAPVDWLVRPTYLVDYYTPGTTQFAYSEMEIPKNSKYQNYWSFIETPATTLGRIDLRSTNVNGETIRYQFLKPLGLNANTDAASVRVRYPAGVLYSVTGRFAGETAYRVGESNMYQMTGLLHAGQSSLIPRVKVTLTGGSGGISCYPSNYLPQIISPELEDLAIWTEGHLTIVGLSYLIDNGRPRTKLTIVECAPASKVLRVEIAGTVVDLRKHGLRWVKDTIQLRSGTLSCLTLMDAQNQLPAGDLWGLEKFVNIDIGIDPQYKPKFYFDLSTEDALTQNLVGWEPRSERMMVSHIAETWDDQGRLARLRIQAPKILGVDDGWTGVSVGCVGQPGEIHLDRTSFMTVPHDEYWIWELDATTTQSHTSYFGGGTPTISLKNWYTTFSNQALVDPLQTGLIRLQWAWPRAMSMSTITSSDWTVVGYGVSPDGAYQFKNQLWYLDTTVGLYSHYMGLYSTADDQVVPDHLEFGVVTDPSYYPGVVSKFLGIRVNNVDFMLSQATYTDYPGDAASLGLAYRVYRWDNLADVTMGMEAIRPIGVVEMHCIPTPGIIQHYRDHDGAEHYGYGSILLKDLENPNNINDVVQGVQVCMFDEIYDAQGHYVSTKFIARKDSSVLPVKWWLEVREMSLILSQDIDYIPMTGPVCKSYASQWIIDDVSYADYVVFTTIPGLTKSPFSNINNRSSVLDLRDVAPTELAMWFSLSRLGQYWGLNSESPSQLGDYLKVMGYADTLRTLSFGVLGGTWVNPLKWQNTREYVLGGLISETGYLSLAMPLEGPWGKYTRAWREVTIGRIKLRAQDAKQTVVMSRPSTANDSNPEFTDYVGQVLVFTWMIQASDWDFTDDQFYSMDFSYRRGTVVREIPEYNLYTRSMDETLPVAYTVYGLETDPWDMSSVVQVISVREVHPNSTSQAGQLSFVVSAMINPKYPVIEMNHIPIANSLDDFTATVLPDGNVEYTSSVLTASYLSARETQRFAPELAVDYITVEPSPTDPNVLGYSSGLANYPKFGVLSLATTHILGRRLLYLVADHNQLSFAVDGDYLPFECLSIGGEQIPARMWLQQKMDMGNQRSMVIYSYPKPWFGMTFYDDLVISFTMSDRIDQPYLYLASAYTGDASLIEYDSRFNRAVGLWVNNPVNPVLVGLNHVKYSVDGSSLCLGFNRNSSQEYIRQWGTHFSVIKLGENTLYLEDAVTHADGESVNYQWFLPRIRDVQRGVAIHLDATSSDPRQTVTHEFWTTRTVDGLALVTSTVVGTGGDGIVGLVESNLQGVCTLDVLTDLDNYDQICTIIVQSGSRHHVFSVTEMTTHTDSNGHVHWSITTPGTVPSLFMDGEPTVIVKLLMATTNRPVDTLTGVVEGIVDNQTNNPSYGWGGYSTIQNTRMFSHPWKSSGRNTYVGVRCTAYTNDRSVLALTMIRGRENDTWSYVMVLGQKLPWAWWTISTVENSDGLDLVEYTLKADAPIQVNLAKYLNQSISLHVYW